MSAWATLPLGQVVTLQRGYDLPHRARESGEIPIVSSAGITDFHDVAMVDPPGVVTGRYGTIGEIFLISEPFWPLNTTLYVRDFHGNDPCFIYYLLQRFDFASFSGKSGVPEVNRNDLHLETVTLPTNLPEQRAIAAALSDVDALLDGLDRLIAKKRDLKQAAMQQLLTGQTRLPGFSESWVTVQLGDISHIKTGDRNHEDKEDGGRFPFFVRSERVERIDSFSYDCEAIIVPGEGNIGSVLHYVSGRFDLHQRAYKISDFPECIHGKFIYFSMAHGFGNHAVRNTVKATVDSLRLPTFLSFELGVPSTICEQRAIATILSDMDAEIAALENRRDKTHDLKQAMMQELLTGKTRLVKPEVAHA